MKPGEGTGKPRRIERSQIPRSRREVLRAGGVGLAGASAALLFGCGDDGGSSDGALDGPPEVTSLRIAKPPPACMAAQYVAERFLADEGIDQVEYVPLAQL
jgi:hypothetical protein